MKKDYKKKYKQLLFKKMIQEIRQLFRNIKNN